ncbi:MAG TPA: hypothetical protein VGR27_12880 [Longimicrobiaceae bacterium]|nr:hypothetical protein [Longimicrobiaceae bacterium]
MSGLFEVARTAPRRVPPLGGTMIGVFFRLSAQVHGAGLYMEVRYVGAVVVAEPLLWDIERAAENEKGDP